MSLKDIPRTSPASAILLLLLLITALLRGVTARVHRGCVETKLDRCVKHDLQPTQRIALENLTGGMKRGRSSALAPTSLRDSR